MIVIHRNPAYHGNAPLHSCPRTAYLRYHQANAAGTKGTFSRVDNNIRREAASPVHYQKSPLHQKETDQKTAISFDVSGYSSDQLKVELQDHVLTVSGERKNRLGDTFSTCRRLALKRDVYDEDSVDVTLTEGVLEIVIQKVTKKARKISISVGGRVLRSSDSEVHSAFETVTNVSSMDGEQACSDVRERAQVAAEDADIGVSTADNGEQTPDNAQQDEPAAHPAVEGGPLMEAVYQEEQEIVLDHSTTIEEPSVETVTEDEDEGEGYEDIVANGNAPPGSVVLQSQTLNLKQRTRGRRL